MEYRTRLTSVVAAVIRAVTPNFNHRNGWFPGHLALLTLIFWILSVSGHAQSCTALTPSGGDDAVQINNCLSASVPTTLATGTFQIFQPIFFPGHSSGVTLTGAGAGSTIIVPQYTCGQPSAFVVNGSYQPLISINRTDHAGLSGFTLDLRNLPHSCNGEDFSIRVGNSSFFTINSLEIVGSAFGTPGYTSGWGGGGGILLFNNDHCTVAGNDVHDLGFLGVGSVGHSGIQIDSSGPCEIRNNTITHVSLGIEITNRSPSQGYRGDSSHDVVDSNTIIGAGDIPNCPNGTCSGGRAIKLEACAVGDEPPVQYLTVTNNVAHKWGGPNQPLSVPKGLLLVCGIQYGTFTGNVFDGRSDPTASYGLEISSSFNSPPNASHHNVFNNNTFLSGGCSGCFDVFFDHDGPDQASGTLSGIPSVGRSAHGTNTFNTVHAEQDRGCDQFGHAFFQYPGGQNFVAPGQSLLLAAAGIRPDSSTITFSFVDASGNTVTSVQYPGGNGNCVMNQQEFFISPSTFPTGQYKVLATYNDGNSDVQIVNDWIG